MMVAGHNKRLCIYSGYNALQSNIRVISGLSVQFPCGFFGMASLSVMQGCPFLMTVAYCSAVPYASRVIVYPV